MLPVDALRPNTEGKQGLTEQSANRIPGRRGEEKACEGTDRHARPHTPRLHKTLPAGTDGSRRGGKKGGDPDTRPVIGKDRGSRTEDRTPVRRGFRAPERKRSGRNGISRNAEQRTGILTAKTRQQEPKRRIGQMSEQETGGKIDGKVRIRKTGIAGSQTEQKKRVPRLLGELLRRRLPTLPHVTAVPSA